MVRIFSFNGRIKRGQYALSFGIYWVVYIFIRVMMYNNAEYRFLGLLMIPMIWFLWAQGAKRCHDMNKSGWWQIIPFYFFVLMFTKGDPWPNKYDIDGHEHFYGADDYERPFDISEPAQVPVTPVNDIVPSASNE